MVKQGQTSNFPNFSDNDFCPSLLKTLRLDGTKCTYLIHSAGLLFLTNVLLQKAFLIVLWSYRFAEAIVLAIYWDFGIV